MSSVPEGATGYGSPSLIFGWMQACTLPHTHAHIHKRQTTDARTHTYTHAGTHKKTTNGRMHTQTLTHMPAHAQIMGGIEGEVDSPFNPARLTPATQPEDKLTRDSRTLRVRFVVDDQEQALQVGGSPRSEVWQPAPSLRAAAHALGAPPRPPHTHTHTHTYTRTHAPTCSHILREWPALAQL